MIGMFRPGRLRDRPSGVPTHGIRIYNVNQRQDICDASNNRTTKTLKGDTKQHAFLEYPELDRWIASGFGIP